MRRAWLLVACLGALACHGGQTQTIEGSSSSEVEEPERSPERSLERVNWVELHSTSELREPLTEVVLDPRAEAALTLEGRGAVELWPSFTGDEPFAWALPFREPIWMSLAAQGEGRFTIAVIDTTNGTRVTELIPNGDGGSGEPGTAKLVPAFAIAPTDPLLELHVLDDGQRILALGVDHRVRLYDLDGRLLSQLDEHGFAPWQLRIRGGDGREPLHLAATLAGPLRVQALALEGDELQRVGEAHEVELDRGPNRNDLALSADGRFVLALRRHKARSPEWSVELIELESGARSLIAGRLDTEVRGRMHPLVGHRLLLESGSGRAFVVDLSRAVELRRRADGHPDSRFALKLARSLEHPTVAVPASAEDFARRDDSGLRMHASVVGEVRATFTRDGGGLVIEALPAAAASDQGERGPSPRRQPVEHAALRHDGEIAAWVSGGQLHVADLRLWWREPGSLPLGGTAKETKETKVTKVTRLAFTKDGELALESSEGRQLITVPKLEVEPLDAWPETGGEATLSSPSLQFVHEGDRILVRNRVRVIWEATGDGVNVVSLSADGTKVIVGDRGGVVVYEIESGKKLLMRETAGLDVSTPAQ